MTGVKDKWYSIMFASPGDSVAHSGGEIKFLSVIESSLAVLLPHVSERKSDLLLLPDSDPIFHIHGYSPTVTGHRPRLLADSKRTLCFLLLLEIITLFFSVSSICCSNLTHPCAKQSCKSSQDHFCWRHFHLTGPSSALIKLACN